MEELFKDKTIFITGGGSIGSELLHQVLEYDIKQVRVFDNNELILHNLKQKYGKIENVRFLFGDIRDINRLSIGMRNADIVFHTAAMKHIIFCEENPIDAIYTNVLGTQNVINTAIKEESEKFINISTDKATNPVNVMGATKLLTERLVAVSNNLKGNTRTVFSSVRFGNVMGSSGSVIPIFKSQIEKGGPITITNKDMVRYMMPTSDAVNLIFKATKISIGGEIFILKMPMVNIMNLAKAMIGDRQIDIKYIGNESSEKIEESLLSLNEIDNSYENEEMIAVIPENLIDYYTKHGFKKLETIGSYYMTLQGIKSLLEKI